MAFTDFNKYKNIVVQSVSGTPTVSRALCLKLTSGDDSTTGTGEIPLDWTNISSKADIAIYDENDNLLDYYFESFDSSNSYAVVWVYKDWIQDGTVQAKVAYGDGSSDQSVSASTVFSKQSNIEAEYLFNETSGDLLDRSGNNNDGTVNGGVTQGTNGIVDGAYDFDGTDDYVEMSNQILRGATYATIQAWIKMDAIAKRPIWTTFWGSNDSDSGNNEGVALQLRDDGDILFWHYYNSAGDASACETTSTPITTDNWFYIVGVKDNDTLRVYVNGSEIQSASSGGDIYGGRAPSIFARYAGGWERFGDGSCDNIHISSTALSSNEISAIYSAAKSSPDFFNQAAAETTPVVTTNNPTFVTDTSATLNGSLGSLEGNSSLDVCFEWGTDTTYGNQTTWRTISTVPADFSEDITGLTAYTTYHYRAVATDGSNYWYGDDVSFMAITTGKIFDVTYSTPPSDLAFKEELSPGSLSVGIDMEAPVPTGRKMFDVSYETPPSDVAFIEELKADDLILWVSMYPAEQVLGKDVFKTIYDVDYETPPSDLAFVKQLNPESGPSAHIDIETIWYGDPPLWAQSMTWAQNMTWAQVQMIVEETTEIGRSWLFEIGEEYYFSTKKLAFAGQVYTARILPETFSGITMRWDISGNSLIAPNDVDFEIDNVDGSLSISDVEGQYCKIICVADGSELRAWTFKIKRAVEHYGKIKCYCVDFLQDILEGTYPNTPSPRDIWSSSDVEPDEDFCVPVVLGNSAYIPVRSVNIGKERWYVLGKSGPTYTVYEGASPHDWPNQSIYSPASYSFNGMLAGGYQLMQPIIADADRDGTADSPGLFRSGNKFLDMLLQYSRSDTNHLTNPADWIRYVLKDFGLSGEYIDTNTFSSLATTLENNSIAFYGGFWRKESREKVLSNMLQQLDCYLVCTDRVYIYQFSKNSREEISNVLSKSFRPERITRSENDGAKVSWPQGMDKPQDVLNGKAAVPTHQGGSTSKPSSDTLQCRFLAGQSTVAQKMGILRNQKKFEQKNRVSMSRVISDFAATDLVPGEVLTINDALYGGTRDIIVTSLKINPDLKADIDGVELYYLEDYSDLAVDRKDVVTDALEGFNLANTDYDGDLDFDDPGHAPLIIPDRITNVATVGLNVTDQFMGYYGQDEGWKVFIRDNGDFQFKGNDYQYINWDADNGQLNVSGAISIRTGEGITNMSDAGRMAARDYVNWDVDVESMPEGATVLRDNDNPSVGLIITGDFMGYHNGTEFMSYIDGGGNFAFRGHYYDNYIKWSNELGKLELKGDIIVDGGSIESANWGESQGTMIDLYNETMQFGGYLDPDFYWNPDDDNQRNRLFIRGSIEVDDGEIVSSDWADSDGASGVKINFKDTPSITFGGKDNPDFTWTGSEFIARGMVTIEGVLKTDSWTDGGTSGSKLDLTGDGWIKMGGDTSPKFFWDGANSTLEINNGTFIGGTVRDSDSNLVIDLKNAEINVNKSDGLIIDSSGGLKITQGSGIKLIGSDSTPGEIAFTGQLATNFYMGSSYDTYDYLGIWPDTDTNGSLVIGGDQTGSAVRFAVVEINVNQDLHLNSSGNISIGKDKYTTYNIDLRADLIDLKSTEGNRVQANQDGVVIEGQNGGDIYLEESSGNYYDLNGSEHTLYETNGNSYILDSGGHNFNLSGGGKFRINDLEGYNFDIEGFHYDSGKDRYQMKVKVDGGHYYIECFTGSNIGW